MELAAALERKVQFMSLQNAISERFQYDRIDGVHYHRVPYSGSADIVDDINQMCRAFVNSVFHVENYMGAHFDIVHAHDWMASNSMVWIKEGRGRKSVLTMHSTEYGRCGNNFYNGRSARIMDHERHGTFCADKVITVSQMLKNELMWIYNLPDWKTSVVPNGISCHQFNGSIDPASVSRGMVLDRWIRWYFLSAG